MVWLGQAACRFGAEISEAHHRLRLGVIHPIPASPSIQGNPEIKPCPTTYSCWCIGSSSPSNRFHIPAPPRYPYKQSSKTPTKAGKHLLLQEVQRPKTLGLQRPLDQVGSGHLDGRHGFAGKGCQDAKCFDQPKKQSVSPICECHTDKPFALDHESGIMARQRTQGVS